VVDAVWNGRAIEPKTLRGLLYELRRKVGETFVPQRRPGDATIGLGAGVSTDLDVLATAIDGDDVDELRAALSNLRGPAFDSADQGWADHHQDAARAAQLVERAALRTADLAAAAGEFHLARSALSRALRALPGNETIYRRRMQLEAGAGDRAAARAVYDELVRVLADHEAEPSPETRALCKALTVS
jgi:hypothetical protein